MRNQCVWKRRCKIDNLWCYNTDIPFDLLIVHFYHTFLLFFVVAIFVRFFDIRSHCGYGNPFIIDVFFKIISMRLNWQWILSMTFYSVLPKIFHLYGKHASKVMTSIDVKQEKKETHPKTKTTIYEEDNILMTSIRLNI